MLSTVFVIFFANFGLQKISFLFREDDGRVEGVVVVKKKSFYPLIFGVRYRQNLNASKLKVFLPFLLSKSLRFQKLWESLKNLLFRKKQVSLVIRGRYIPSFWTANPEFADKKSIFV